jgi:uncharacterized protein YneF (UPF0154 family)
MQNTILIISLTLITALTVGYFLRARKSKNELKNRGPDGQDDKSEMKTDKAAVAEL